MHDSIQARVPDFISHSHWHIPHLVRDKASEVVREIQQVCIPFAGEQDSLIWSGTESGVFTFKDAYSFLHQGKQSVNWGKVICSSSIPPSMSFLLWGSIHNKKPTNDNLRARGCVIVSSSSLCGSDEESSLHLSFSHFYVELALDQASTQPGSELPSLSVGRL